MADLGPLDGDVVELDGRGLCAIPGLVDCHTHPAFGGDRVEEFSLRAAGASYEELHEAGGGILSTVRATREAGADGIARAVERHRSWMLRAGTTTWEGKSGYGLDRDTELASLRADRGRRAACRPGSARTPSRRSSRARTPTSTSPSRRCCPKRRTSPRPRTSSSSGARSTRTQARRYLEACARAGLALRLHGDQFTEAGAIPLAIELGARSVDHLEATGPDGVAALAQSDVVGVLPPDGGARARPADAPGPSARRRGGGRGARDRLQPGELVLREPAARVCARRDPARARAGRGARGRHRQRRARARACRHGRPDRARLPRGRRPPRRARLASPRLPPRRRSRRHGRGRGRSPSGYPRRDNGDQEAAAAPGEGAAPRVGDRLRRRRRERGRGRPRTRRRPTNGRSATAEEGAAAPSGRTVQPPSWRRVGEARAPVRAGDVPAHDVHRARHDLPRAGVLHAPAPRDLPALQLRHGPHDVPHVAEASRARSARPERLPRSRARPRSRPTPAARRRGSARPPARVRAAGGSGRRPTLRIACRSAGANVASVPAPASVRSPPASISIAPSTTQATRARSPRGRRAPGPAWSEMSTRARPVGRVEHGRIAGPVGCLDRRQIPVLHAARGYKRAGQRAAVHSRSDVAGRGPLRARPDRDELLRRPCRRRRHGGRRGRSGRGAPTGSAPSSRADGPDVRGDPRHPHALRPHRRCRRPRGGDRGSGLRSPTARRWCSSGRRTSTARSGSTSAAAAPTSACRGTRRLDVAGLRFETMLRPGPLAGAPVVPRRLRALLRRRPLRGLGRAGRPAGRRLGRAAGVDPRAHGARTRPRPRSSRATAPSTTLGAELAGNPFLAELRAS